MTAGSSDSPRAGHSSAPARRWQAVRVAIGQSNEDSKRGDRSALPGATWTAGQKLDHGVWLQPESETGRIARTTQKRGRESLIFPSTPFPVRSRSPLQSRSLGRPGFGLGFARMGTTWSGLGLKDVAHHLEMCVEAADLIDRMFVNQRERGAIGEGETGIRILHEKSPSGLAPERFRNPMNRQCPRIHGLADEPEELDRFPRDRLRNVSAGDHFVEHKKSDVSSADPRAIKASKYDLPALILVRLDDDRQPST